MRKNGLQRVSHLLSFCIELTPERSTLRTHCTPCPPLVVSRNGSAGNRQQRLCMALPKTFFSLSLSLLSRTHAQGCVCHRQASTCLVSRTVSFLHRQGTMNGERARGIVVSTRKRECLLAECQEHSYGSGPRLGQHPETHARTALSSVPLVVRGP